MCIIVGGKEPYVNHYVARLKHKKQKLESQIEAMELWMYIRRGCIS